MKMPDAWLAEDVQTTLADPHAHKFAPFVLHGCIPAFTAGTLRKALDGAGAAGEGRHAVASCVAACGNRRVRPCERERRGMGAYYDADHGTVTPEETIAWARPLSSMTQASLTGPRGTSRLVDRERRWS